MGGAKYTNDQGRNETDLEQLLALLPYLWHSGYYHGLNLPRRDLISPSLTPHGLPVAQSFLHSSKRLQTECDNLNILVKLLGQFCQVTCFLIFNVFNYLGTVCAGVVQWPGDTSRDSQVTLLIMACSRLLLIPTLMMCNVAPSDRHQPVSVNTHY